MEGERWRVKRWGVEGSGSMRGWVWVAPPGCCIPCIDRLIERAREKNIADCCEAETNHLFRVSLRRRGGGTTIPAWTAAIWGRGGSER